ncbi:hypothetical protein AAZX31_14G015400 [Glycine max]
MEYQISTHPLRTPMLSLFLGSHCRQRWDKDSVYPIIN